jgi:hypothetical protein
MGMANYGDSENAPMFLQVPLEVPSENVLLKLMKIIQKNRAVRFMIALIFTCDSVSNLVGAGEDAFTLARLVSSLELRKFAAIIFHDNFFANDSLKRRAPLG